MELYEIDSNRIPAGAQARVLAASDGTVLRAAHWPARLYRRGCVAIFPGRGEFIEKYFETIDRLLARGFDVAALDWRGQGLSARETDNARKGHVDDFSLYERDVEAFVEQVLSQCPKPWFALAHSLGAAILLGMAAERRCSFDRLVLSAPMIEIQRIKDGVIGGGLIKILDNIGFGAAFAPGSGETSHMTFPFENNELTGDEKRYRRNAEIVSAFPQLAIGGPTIGWLHSALRQCRKLADPNAARRIDIPILAFSAGGDSVVENAAMGRFFSRVKIGRLIEIPGARHEILQERDAVLAQFWDAFDAFVPGRSLQALDRDA